MEAHGFFGKDTFEQQSRPQERADGVAVGAAVTDAQEAFRVLEEIDCLRDVGLGKMHTQTERTKSGLLSETKNWPRQRTGVYASFGSRFNDVLLRAARNSTGCTFEEFIDARSLFGCLIDAKT